MKGISILLLTMSLTLFASEGEIKLKTLVDGIKVQQSLITSKHNLYQYDLQLSNVIPKDVEKSENKQLIDSINEIRFKYIKSIEEINTEMQQGAYTVPVIFSAIQTGINLGLLSSPYSVQSIRNKYDSFYGYAKYLPIIAGAVVPAVVDMSEKKSFYSLAIGISITSIFSEIGNSNTKNKTDEVLKEVSATSDVIALNRDVYRDMVVLDSMISNELANKDSLAKNYSSFKKRYNWKNINYTAEAIKINGFDTYVDTSLMYLEQVTEKVKSINLLIFQVNKIMMSYNQQVVILEARYKDNVKASTIIADVKKAIENVKSKVDSFSGAWYLLSNQSYTLSYDDKEMLNKFKEYTNLLALIK
jgi:hypothetical protein